MKEKDNILRVMSCRFKPDEYVAIKRIKLGFKELKAFVIVTEYEAGFNASKPGREFLVIFF